MNISSPHLFDSIIISLDYNSVTTLILSLRRSSLWHLGRRPAPVAFGTKVLPVTSCGGNKQSDHLNYVRRYLRNTNLYTHRNYNDHSLCNTEIPSLNASMQLLRANVQQNHLAMGNLPELLFCVPACFTKLILAVPDKWTLWLVKKCLVYIKQLRLLLSQTHGWIVQVAVQFTTVYVQKFSTSWITL